jgi:hypothetical protein
MRTNIVINDDLMNEAIVLTRLKNKKEMVELGLKTLIRLKNQEKNQSLQREIGLGRRFGQHEKQSMMNGMFLLHSDRDFEPFERCLNLKSA